MTGVGVGGVVVIFIIISVLGHHGLQLCAFLQVWLTAMKNKINSGTFFWPGADVAIQGRFPTFYQIYNGSVHTVDLVLKVMVRSNSDHSAVIRA